MEDVRICPRCRRIHPAQATVCSDCGHSLAGTAVTDVPEAEITLPDPQPEPGALTCPACGVAMQWGNTRLTYSRLLWNWNVLTMKLIFRLRDRPDEAVVMSPGYSRRSARCPRCDGVWISARAW
jgi:hypothetical protein